jgi:excisionase family DNA binding protein
MEVTMGAVLALKDLPTLEEITIAKECSRELSALLSTRNGIQQVELKDRRGGSHIVSIPQSALRLLVDILTEIGEGNALNIIPIHAELTTQEAADALNVSRPFLVKLLEEGKMKHRRVGTHRRVLYEDLVAYKKKVDEDRHNVLDELAKQAQELDMGY